MSYKIIEQVIAEQPEHKTKGAALSVLLFLAHRAKDHASPFVKFHMAGIAKSCGITVRYTAKVLAKLEKDGQLFINHRGGNGSNYIIPHGFSKEVIAQTMVKMMGLDHYSSMLHAAWLKTGEGERPPVEVRSLRGDVKEKRQQEPEAVTTRNGELLDIVETMNSNASSACSQKGTDDELLAPDDELLDIRTMTPSSSVKVLKEVKGFKEEKEALVPSTSQTPAPAPAPKPAPTDPIDQELVILKLYSEEITPLPGNIEVDHIVSDIGDLSQAGYNALDVFRYAITQAVLGDARKLKYIQAIVKNIRDSKMPLAAYIEKRQAKTKRNGGTNGHSANSNGAGNHQADDNDHEGQRIEAFLASRSA